MTRRYQMHAHIPILSVPSMNMDSHITVIVVLQWTPWCGVLQKYDERRRAIDCCDDRRALPGRHLPTPRCPTSLTAPPHELPFLFVFLRTSANIIDDRNRNSISDKEGSPFARRYGMRFSDRERAKNSVVMFGLVRSCVVVRQIVIRMRTWLRGSRQRWMLWLSNYRAGHAWLLWQL